MTVTPEQKAAIIGWSTLGIGAALAAAPAASARALHLGDHAGAVRVIGVADLALVPGLIAGCPRWPWVVARMALNVAIGGYAARLFRRERRPAAAAFAASMVVATIGDSTIARPLLAARP